jgi:hypothetical protein
MRFWRKCFGPQTHLYLCVICRCVQGVVEEVTAVRRLTGSSADNFKTQSNSAVSVDYRGKIFASSTKSCRRGEIINMYCQSKFRQRLRIKFIGYLRAGEAEESDEDDADDDEDQ